MKVLAKRLAGFSLAVICLSASAQSSSSKGVDVIGAYAGTWQVSMEHFDTANSKASKETTHLRNECWKSGAYYACNQYVNGESKVLLVFTYDEASKEYTSYQIPQGGGQAGSGKLRIEGSIWTFPWEQSEGGKTTWFRVVNVFSAPDAIEMRQEFSTDQVHWIVMARATEKRIADPK